MPIDSTNATHDTATGGDLARPADDPGPRDRVGAGSHTICLMGDVTGAHHAGTERGLLTSVIDQSAAGLVLLNPDSSIRYANPAACALIGYGPDSLTGMPLSTVIPPSELQRSHAIHDTVRTTGRWAGEVVLQARDKTNIPAHLSASAILDSAGQLIAYVGHWVDLRPIQAAQARLRESEARLQSITRATRDGILMIDCDGRIDYWNPAAEHMFGYAEGEVMGVDLHQLLAPHCYRRECADGFAGFLSDCDGEMVGQTVELEAIRKDGSEFLMELSVSPLRMDGAWHAVGIVRDITARRRAESTLRESEERYRTLAENLSEVIYRADPVTLTATYINPAVEEVYGYSAEEWLADPELWERTIHPDDHDRVIRSVTQAHADTANTALEYRIIHRNGTVRWVSDRLSWEQGPHGTVVSQSGVLSDITERKNAEAALAGANRALQALSSCNSVLIHSTSETAILNDMCRVIVEAGGYPYVWIAYTDNDDHRIRPMGSAGFSDDFFTTLDVTWEELTTADTPTGYSMQHGVNTIVRDVQSDPGMTPWRSGLEKLGIGAVCCFPLRQDDEVFGALTIYARNTCAFAHDELMLLSELAADLNFGILTLRTRAAHERLQEQQIQSAEQLRETLTDAIGAIARTVEKRDPYTAGHQQRVANLCVAIGNELGLAEDQVEGLRLGASIHDIGKVYVPAEIINRPGKLTAAEFNIIRAHSEVGYDIVKDVRFTWPVATMILQHHERLDGSGYPNGLAGDEIILEARIIAVADTVEAMSAHRPYRPARGLDAALAEIRQHRGVRYDAAVVDACVHLFTVGGLAFDQQAR